MSVLARKRAEDGNPLEMHEMMLKVEEDAGTAGNDLEKSPNSGVPSKDSKKAACSGKAVEKQVKFFIFLDWFYIISVVSLSELVLSEMVFFALNSWCVATLVLVLSSWVFIHALQDYYSKL